MLRNPDDDLADTRELSYAGATGFNIFDESKYSVASQPAFVGRNVRAYRHEQHGEFEKAEALYRENIEKGETTSHCYERLAIMYRKQKRYDDEVAILEKHLVLPGSDQQKVALRLGKAMLLKQGIRVVKTKQERIEAKKKQIAEIKETLRISNMRALQGYKMSGVVVGVEVLCGKDERTCAACKKLSMQKFTLDAAPKLPYDKCTNDYCRCAYVPIAYSDPIRPPVMIQSDQAI